MLLVMKRAVLLCSMYSVCIHALKRIHIKVVNTLESIINVYKDCIRIFTFIIYLLKISEYKQPIISYFIF